MKYIPLICLALTEGLVLAQTEGNITVVDPSTNPAQVINEFDLREKAVKGTFYLRDDWYQGTITMKSGKQIRNYPLRFDIENNQLEIKLENQVKVLESSDLDRFEWYNQDRMKKDYFENCSNYRTVDGVPLVGILEILVDGETKLATKTDTRYKQSNYNVALDVGDRDDKIVKSKKQYLIQGVTIYDYPRSKKELIAFFGDDGASMDEYIKVNSLKIKKDEDAARIIEYYNHFNK